MISRFFLAFNVISTLFWMVLAILIFFDVTDMKPDTTALIACIAMSIVTGLMAEREAERLTK